ncbi:MAG: hypothetical protein Q8Q09_16815 [Deltaproteobacteria bacterium]|nr:hypothetical protein [Deltaproteobacteria bacterium]
MGTLVRAASQHFLLQHKDHPAALASLKRFAAERPHDVRDACALAEAHTLTDALRDAGYDATLDAHQDLTALAYAWDKAPMDAGDLWLHGLLEALAPSGRLGRGALKLFGSARLHPLRVQPWSAHLGAT